MDCRTARHLLDFNRPHAPELDRTDQQLLDGHLAVCPDCDALARAERQLDDRLGEAVRDVPVPQGLHERIVQRLHQEREGWYRTQLGRGLRVFAAAAAVFLVAWFGLSAWRQHHLPRPSDDELAQSFNPMTPPDRRDAEHWFGRNVVETNGPSDFNYQYLCPVFGFAHFRGEKVPCMTFLRPSDDGERPRAVAYVHILSRRQFDLGGLSELSKPYSPPRFKVEVRKPTAEYAYVIVYSGNLNDLLAPRSEPPGS